MNKSRQAEFLEIEKRLIAEWREIEDELLHSLVQTDWDWRIRESIRARALKEDWSPDEYETRLNSLRGLADKLCEALHGGQLHLVEGDKSRPRFFWRHQMFDLFRAGDQSRDFAIDRHDLKEVASTYLSHPELQNNPFDWHLLDALIFAELDAFGDQAMETKLGTGTNLARALSDGSLGKYALLTLVFGVIAFILRYIALPALAFYLAMNGHEELAISVGAVWALYVLFRLFTIPARWRAKKKSRQLLEALVSTYAILGDSTISPRRLRESLDSAAATGVIFDGAVFSLVDRMNARDATTFVPNS